MSTARRFVSRNARPTIGLLNDKFDVGYLGELCAGVTAMAKARDVNLLSFPGGKLRSVYEFEYQRNVLYDMVGENNVDGLIILVTLIHFTPPEDRTRFLERYQALPAVTVAISFPNIPSVNVDNMAGMRDALRHFIVDHGYRRIAFIRGPENDKDADERYRVYTEVLAAYDIPLDPQIVVPGYYYRASGVTAMQMLLDERQADCDAVMAANDLMAFGAMEVLAARGIRVPQDLAIAGFDDILEARSTTVPLTTVRQPLREMGSRAVELVLAMIAGERVPEQVILPSQLVVRQSCGCLPSHVAQASAGVGVATAGTFEQAVIARRETMLCDMTQAIGADQNASRWAADVLDAFLSELQGASEGNFVSTLATTLHEVASSGSDSAIDSGQAGAAWQNMLSVLRRQFLPCLNDPQMVSLAEDLWQQARVMIGETAQQLERYKQLQAEQHTRQLREIEAAMITTFDLEDLMGILGERLPQLGIPSCYLALYEHPQTPAEEALLSLAYDEYGRVELVPQEQRFPVMQIIPNEFLPQHKSYQMVIEALYFKEHQLGFVVFGSGLHDDVIYEALREKISSTLKGSLLVLEVQEHVSELAEANGEIRMLNDQLKDENLRMRAEMDLARRIQTSLLPSLVQPLHLDFEIAAVMLPAEEVGGDYFDVMLDREGSLWFGIGDVSGHGVTPGLIMMMAQTVHTTITTSYQATAKDVVVIVNKVLYKNVHDRMDADHFMTFTTLKYLDKGRFQHAGAHLDLVVYRKKQKICERIDTQGAWLNLLPDIAHATENLEFTLDIGDVLVLYTDGLTEVWNKEQKMLDIHGFMEIVTTHAEKNVHTLRDAIIADVMEWCRHTRDDDMSLVVARRVQ